MRWRIVGRCAISTCQQPTTTARTSYWLTRNHPVCTAQGIGKAYATQLAKSGVNVVLIARSPVSWCRVETQQWAWCHTDYSAQDKLRDTAAEIQGKYSRIQVRRPV
jgi:hypothetical protein